MRTFRETFGDVSIEITYDRAETESGTVRLQQGDQVISTNMDVFGVMDGVYRQALNVLLNDQVLADWRKRKHEEG